MIALLAITLKETSCLIQKFHSFSPLLNWILPEKEQSRSIFGNRLATPIGPATGSHAQPAQDIICTRLSGGRFIGQRPYR